MVRETRTTGLDVRYSTEDPVQRSLDLELFDQVTSRCADPVRKVPGEAGEVETSAFIFPEGALAEEPDDDISEAGVSPKAFQKPKVFRKERTKISQLRKRR